MDSGVTGLANTSKSARELSRDAITLALNGEWERASEVNRWILELSEGDVDAMNRLGKALMELARYPEAREVLDRVTTLAPYNNIAKKNLARLVQLETTPTANNQVRKAGGGLQLFIEESGKSGTTVLIKAVTGQATARLAPSDPAHQVTPTSPCPSNRWSVSCLHRLMEPTWRWVREKRRAPAGSASR